MSVEGNCDDRHGGGASVSVEGNRHGDASVSVEGNCDDRHGDARVCPSKETVMIECVHP